MIMESTSITEPPSLPQPRPPFPHAPNTPEQAPPAAAKDAHPGVRRVHTLPAKLAGNAGSSAASAVPAPDSVETLFVHPAAKVVSFTVAGGGARPGSSAGRRASIDVNSEGSLAWEYPSERTLAAGQLRIYRVPSSGVSFLNSGLLLHPILKRSQCWLVDEQSKFVLRVREGSYYRVELPYNTEEEKAQVDEFKKALSRVLQYEKTPSPFRKGYVPESIEPPKTPVKRSSRPREKAKKWRLNKVWEPEDPEHRKQWSPQNTQEEDPASWRKHLRPRMVAADSADSASSHSTTEDEGTTTDESAEDGSSKEDVVDNVRSKIAHIEESPQAPLALPIQLRSRPDATRSITAPPQLLVDTTSGAELEALSRIPSRESDTASVASSHDSYYSVDEAAIAAEAREHVPDLIDHEHMSTINAARSNHSRQISEITITPSTPTPLSNREDAREPSDPSTPTLVSDTEDEQDLPFLDAVTPPDTIRLRRIPQHLSDDPDHEHALQSLRHRNSFYNSNAPSRKRAISAALVQKAYSLLVGPPSHLVSLMLDIAARIVRSMQGARDMSRRMPGAWNSSHAEEEDEWEEDDFGIPLDNLRRDSSMSSAKPDLRRIPSRASVADSDYDALIEGPMLRRSVSRRSSGSLD